MYTIFTDIIPEGPCRLKLASLEVELNCPSIFIYYLLSGSHCQSQEVVLNVTSGGPGVSLHRVSTFFSTSSGSAPTLLLRTSD